MADSKRIEHRELVQFFKQTLMTVGTPSHVAEVEAENGAEVDLCGVHSHGVRLLPVMVENIQTGLTNPDPEVKILAAAAGFDACGDRPGHRTLYLCCRDG